MSGGSRGTGRLSSKWSSKHFNLRDTWKVMTNLMQMKTADMGSVEFRNWSFPLSLFFVHLFTYMYLKSSKLNSGGRKVLTLFLLVNEESLRDTERWMWIQPLGLTLILVDVNALASHRSWSLGGQGCSFMLLAGQVVRGLGVGPANTGHCWNCKSSLEASGSFWFHTEQLILKKRARNWLGKHTWGH